MDIFGSLPDEVILEIFDEEWVQTVDYVHIPFRCRKCHEHGHLFRDCPLSKIDNKSKPNIMKDTESFQKVASRGKCGKKGPNQQRNEGQKGSQNRFQVPEENEEKANEDQSMEDDPNENEKEENCNPTQEIGNKKETMMSETKLEMD